MGSSLVGPSPWITASIVFAILYLIFDAARYFVYRVGAVRLRRWSSEPGMARGGAWFNYDPDQFSLISGALLQVSLVAGVCCALGALEGMMSLTDAAIVTATGWAAIVVAWKFVLALVPEDLAEPCLRSLIAVSHLFYYLFWPILAPLNWTMRKIAQRRDVDEEQEEVSDEEVQAYIDVGEEEGILEEGEGRLVQSIVDFGDRIAREVMTPRVEIQAFDANGRVDDLAGLFSESKYSRIPVYEGNIDRVVGIVHVKDLFDVVLHNQEKSVRDLMHPAFFIAETKKVSELLREFQIEHLQVGIVVDEFGGTAGLVSVEDLVEEIVGEIADEHEDEEHSIVEVEPGVYLVNGKTHVEALEEVYDVELRDEGYETVTGLLFTATGRVPKVNEVVKKSGLQFEVERADRRRIYRVRVMRDPAWAEHSVVEQK